MKTDNSSHQKRKKGKIRVLSTFSGCGGLDLGFKNAGYNLVWAIDNLKDAVETYTKNIGDHIVYEDIKKIDHSELPDCDIVIGGPPCQSFSLVGKRDPSDPRGGLIWNYFQIVKEKAPRIFLMENVPGLKSAKDSSGIPVLPELLKSFEDLGYTTNYFILNSADYGVPQLRRRLFIIGSKTNEKIPPPEPTHMKKSLQQSLIYLKPWVSTRETLDDLPTPRDDNDIAYYTKDPDSDYQRYLRSKKYDLVHNHQMPYMSETDLKIIREIKPGGNYMDVPDAIATTRIKNFKRTGGRTTTYGRLNPSMPSYTLNTHFSRPNVGCNIHYSEDRLLTLREGLRIQSFPDDFKLYCNTKRGAYTIVGNAVPPLLSTAIAKHLVTYF
jgi:DNA (cytosine-5)-methyltransferase 1